MEAPLPTPPLALPALLQAPAGLVTPRHMWLHLLGVHRTATVIFSQSLMVFSQNISEHELSLVKELVYEYSDIFSRSEFDLGHCAILPHRIDTGDARPFKEQLRCHPIAHLDFIDNQVDQMLQAGVIEHCSSPWSSNVVLAKKSYGTLRFCVDYRRLNDLTYKDSFPLPRIDTCLDALGGSIFFSTMGLRSGLWQVATDPRDADKTAFLRGKGSSGLRY